MNDLQKFFSSSLDTADIGLETDLELESSVFTPTDARILGRANEHIHFCCCPDGTILGVDRCAAPGENILPIAASFPEFLGLILACKGTYPLLRARYWSRMKFEAHAQTCTLSLKQRSILRAIENIYHPPKISDPYDALIAFQDGFDYDSIRLHPDYDEHCPIRPGKNTWSVTFDSDLFPYLPEGRPCKERVMEKSFTLGAEQWQIPAIYTCDKGIVVDCIEQIPLEAIRAFTEKWQHLDQAELSRRQKLQMDAQRPGFGWMGAALKVGSNTIHNYTSHQLSWNPLECDNWKARMVCAHYGLDIEKAWVIRRYCFNHRIKKKTVLTPLSIQLRPEETSIPGPCFTAAAAGESLDFIHPVTGQSHKLTVLDFSREALDPNFLYNPPCHYCVLTYDLDPPLGRDQFLIQDTAENDPLRTPVGQAPEGAVVIGGADGPTAIFFTAPKSKLANAAASSLHYEPAEQVTWQLVFKEKRAEAVTVELLK